MKKQEIILIGGGGHCKSCIDVIESTELFTIKGIIDVAEKVGETIFGYPIIGSDSDLVKLRQYFNKALVTLGSIKSAELRKDIFENLKELDFALPVIQASTAYVSEHAQLGEGTIVMHHAFVNAETNIGDNVILNTKSLIEHDVVIGNHTHVATNAVINGTVVIGDECFIGSNSTVNNNLHIHSNVIVGSNSTVHINLEEEGIYVGTPVIKI